MTESVSIEDYEKLKKSVEFVINRRKEVDAENLAKREKMKKEHRDFVKNLPYWFSLGVMIISTEMQLLHVHHVLRERACVCVCARARVCVCVCVRA